MGTFAARLRELRLRSGLSQRELAIKAGVHENYIARLERGERTNPSRDMVAAIARALDVPAAVFYPDERPASVADLLRDLSERCRMLETTQVPLRGTVPGEVREHTSEYIEVPMAQYGEEGIRDVYALEVVEPLADEGIDSGDYVVIAPAEPVKESGGVYVVSLCGHNLLRRAWRVGSHVRIRPAADGVTEFPVGDVTVVGRVVLGGRWRRF